MRGCRPGLTTEVIRAVLSCLHGGEDPAFGWCTGLRAVPEGELAALDRRIAALRCCRTALARHLADSGT
ncbi:hypothetical protein [Streptomyces sp. CC210A]|uniref:hypothetical protein n=1 Tax=Streptomyces sp. CC210A TaxID=2898184 RepID=UPI001F2160D5|nr:hypothetical protein [Streptomyces sp. CC210A]